MQGAAEVVPVSSSAQLALLPWLLRWDPPQDRTRFAAGLHAGSAVGLALALRHDLTPRALVRALLLSLPAAAAGLVAGDLVEEQLGGPAPTAALLATAGAALWLADRSSESGRSGERAASLAQVAALAPGVSRTGATLTALRAAGVPRDQALRTSLVMSLPVTAGAAALTAVRGKELPPAGPTLLAGVTAYAAARRVRGSQRLVTASVLYRLALSAVVAARLRKERS